GSFSSSPCRTAHPKRPRKAQSARLRVAGACLGHKARSTSLGVISLRELLAESHDSRVDSRSAESAVRCAAGRRARKLLDTWHSVIVNYNSMRNRPLKEKTHEDASFRPGRRFDVARRFRADRGAAADRALRYARACADGGAESLRQTENAQRFLGRHPERRPPRTRGGRQGREGRVS